ncbi:hypothetical protein JG688_00018676 [Phytophthora aleatoria]|uniref:Uncharacterized protein n=1 Tax=Phytophthora aleatoria TaxID=2496075 RepID=A0A8J5LXI1_9STRA|nr:hypothetical protein JG688_00018676 [Phytophthora aleatoria]
MRSRLNQNATEKTKLSALEAENRELKKARPQGDAAVKKMKKLEDLEIKLNERANKLNEKIEALASSKDSAVAFDPSVKEAEAARTAWKKEKEELLVQMEQLHRIIEQLEEQDKKASSCISKLQQALDAEQLAVSHSKILSSGDFRGQLRYIQQLQDKLQDQEILRYDLQLKPDSYTACCYTEQTIDHFTEDHTIDYEHMTRVQRRQYVVDQAKRFKNSPYGNGSELRKDLDYFANTRNMRWTVCTT